MEFYPIMNNWKVFVGIIRNCLNLFDQRYQTKKSVSLRRWKISINFNGPRRNFSWICFTYSVSWIFSIMTSRPPSHKVIQYEGESPSPLEYNIIIASKRSIPFEIHTSGEWLWAKQKKRSETAAPKIWFTKSYKKPHKSESRCAVLLGWWFVLDHSIDGTDNLFENLLQSHFQHLLNTDHVLILEITGMRQSIVEELL